LKKIFYLLFLLQLSFCAVAQKQFVVDENASVRILNAGFNCIEVKSGIHLYITKGEQEAIAVSAAEEKIKNNIRTEIVDSTLKIYYDNLNNNWRNNPRLNVYVSYTHLKEITASGASNVLIADELKAESLALKLSGASDLKGSIQVKDFSIKMSGASDVKLSGKATNAIFECSGASDCKAYELSCEQAIAKASGASDVSVTVTNEFTANASGASNISYKGNAAMKGKYSGGTSSISKTD
jgi:hypothetical protein